MRKIAVLTLVGLWTASSAIGQADVITGDLGTYFGAPTATAYNTAYDHPDSFWQPTKPGVSWWAEDTTQLGGVPSCVGPGYGGQNFDVEAAYMTSSGGKLYGGFVSGFDLQGQYGWNKYEFYHTGDLFFDTNGDGKWDLAVALSTRTINGFTFQQGYAYTPTSSQITWYTKPDPYTSSEPSQLTTKFGAGFTQVPSYLVGFEYIPGGTADDNATAYPPYQKDDHNVVIVSLDGSLLTGSTVTMHYTEDCGNDFFNLTTPEPGLALLALGAAVAGAYARRRKGRLPSGPRAA